MSQRRLRIGVVGLGRAFTLMLPPGVAPAVPPRRTRVAGDRYFAQTLARTYAAVEVISAPTAPQK